MPFVDVNHVKLHYREREGGSPTLLFLHGNLASSRWWEKIFPLLPVGWRALALDLRGYGLSDRPASGYSVDVWTADVEAFVRAKKIERMVLVGHSLGGAVALQYALDYPSVLAALVLLDPVPADGLHLGPQVFELLASMQRTLSAMKEGLIATAPAALVDAFFDQLVAEGFRSIPAAFKEIPAALSGFDVFPRLSTLSVPTLCLLGEHDLLIPRRDIERMQRRIPNSRLAIISGVGHSPQIENPPAFMKHLLTFMEDCVQP